MLLAVSPMHTLAALLFLAGIFFSAKSYFDYREARIRQPFQDKGEKRRALARTLATGEVERKELDIIEA